jgi:hypothetical protein
VKCANGNCFCEKVVTVNLLFVDMFRKQKEEGYQQAVRGKTACMHGQEK